MITLALSQLVYYLGNGAFAYGGDDGLNIIKRSDFGGLINLDHRPSFYYLCWVILAATIYLCHRAMDSRFGMVLQGAKPNDRRMATIGFPVHRYRLTAFIIAGMVCGLAGVLTATYHQFHQPGDAALEPLGRSHRHGCARRHGQPVRPAVWHGRLPAAGRNPLQLD